MTGPRQAQAAFGRCHSDGARIDVSPKDAREVLSIKARSASQQSGGEWSPRWWGRRRGRAWGRRGGSVSDPTEGRGPRRRQDADRELHALTRGRRSRRRQATTRKRTQGRPPGASIGAAHATEIPATGSAKRARAGRPQRTPRRSADGDEERPESMPDVPVPVATVRVPRHAWSLALPENYPKREGAGGRRSSFRLDRVVRGRCRPCGGGPGVVGAGRRVGRPGARDPRIRDEPGDSAACRVGVADRCWSMGVVVVAVNAVVPTTPDMIT